MSISIGLKPQVGQALAAGGQPAPFNPRPVVFGPFLFGATIPDNATTTQDLKTASAQRSASLITGLGFGSDNPDIAMLVTGVRVIIPDSSISEADLASIYQYLTLKFEAQESQARYFGLGSALNTMVKQTFALDSDEATLTTFHNVEEGYLDLSDQPFVVDFSADTFDMYMHTAADMAAAVPVLLQFSGAAWAGGYGKPEAQSCQAGQLTNAKVQELARNALALPNRQLSPNR